MVGLTRRGILILLPILDTPFSPIVKKRPTGVGKPLGRKTTLLGVGSIDVEDPAPHRY